MRRVIYFLRESVLVKSRIELDKPKKVTDGCEHALANMIPIVRSDIHRPEDWRSCIKVGFLFIGEAAVEALFEPQISSISNLLALPLFPRTSR